MDLHRVIDDDDSEERIKKHIGIGIHNIFESPSAALKNIIIPIEGRKLAFM